MDIYERKSKWKLYLGIIGSAIVLITMFYSLYLARELESFERSRIELYAEAIKSVTKSNFNDQDDQNLEILILKKIKDIPVVQEDEEGNLTGENYNREVSQEFLQREKQRYLDSGKEPIEGIGYSKYIYYRNSRLLTYIKLFPFIQIVMLGAFILLGYVGLSNSRKAEQNRVWAGMAKETAHQLGTPISAIIGWIEHLKMDEQISTDQLEILGELTNDVSRLELIADRFSKIGSMPKLVQSNIVDDIQKTADYMKKRAPKRVVFNVIADEDPITAGINHHLFEWVVENLMRNSLDAMAGEGKIEANVYRIEDWVFIDISDTGKGIPNNKMKTVFQPGFSTKKRGWGLGLSLAKRIIEDYHKGKIFVKTSKINEGTTFTIQLPAHN